MPLRPASTAGALLAGALLLCAAPASANMFEVYGAGARSLGLAGAGAAITADPTAVWYNPAGLDRSGDAVTFGVLAGFNRGSILLSPRPAGYEAPSYAGRLRLRQDATDPESHAGVMIGLSMSLISDNLHLGLLLYAPFSGFGHLSSWYADEREQNFSNQLQWELIGDRLKSEVIAGGVSYRMSDRFTLGVGVNVLPRTRNVGQIYTRNAVEPADVDLNLNVDQGATFGLTAGLMVQPLDQLTVGLSVQDENFFTLEGHNDIELPETGEVPRQRLDFNVHHTPPRGLLGLAWTLGDYTLTGDLIYSGWSRYRDTRNEDAGFNDTLDGRIGVEYRARDTRIRAGAGWASSPVPEQRGRTSYVDTDRLILAVGAGREINWLGRTFEVDLGMQIHLLRPQETTKTFSENPPDCGPEVDVICDELPDQDRDELGLRAEDTVGLQTGNPGWPGFSQGGYLVSVGADARWRF